MVERFDCLIKYNRFGHKGVGRLPFIPTLPATITQQTKISLSDPVGQD
jgi:hypothetical protein